MGDAELSGTHCIIPTGIERNIRGNSPAVIRREIKPEAVELPRRKDEGTKPLHKRDEFRTREELVEKRVIKVSTMEPVVYNHLSFVGSQPNTARPVRHKSLEFPPVLWSDSTKHSSS